jgi:hypothetical protein
MLYSVVIETFFLERGLYNTLTHIDVCVGVLYKDGQRERTVGWGKLMVNLK